MASIPLPALHVQTPEQPDLLQKMGQIGALKNQAVQGQLQQGELQQQQLQLKQQQDAARDEDILTKSYMDAKGDLNQTALLAAQRGASPGAVIKAKQAGMDFNAKLAKMHGDELDNLQKTSTMQANAIYAIKQLPPEQRPQGVQDTIQGFVQQGTLPPEQAQQYLQSIPLNDPQALDNWLNVHGTSSMNAAQAAEARKNKLEGDKAQQGIDQGAQLFPNQLAKSQADASQAQKVNAGTSSTGITAEQQARLRFEQQRVAAEQQRAARQDSKKGLDEQAIETAAQSLAGGDLTRLKDIASMRGDQRLLIYNRAKQLNPMFNTGEVDRKIKMEDSFTNGKDGQNLQSFGTFLEHAGAASDIVNQYRSSNVKLINTPLNKLRDAFGDAAYTQYTAALEPVRKEFEGFLLGGKALYGDDRKAAETILSDNATPAQQQAALKQMGHTVQARYNESNFRYKRTMGKDLQDAISPEAMTGAQKIGINLGGSSSQQSGSTQGKPVYVSGKLVGYTTDGKTMTPAQ